VALLVPAVALLLAFLGLGYIGIGGGFTGAVWLFVVFGVVFGLASLLMAWTFVGWARQPKPERPPRIRRTPFRNLRDNTGGR